MTTQTEAERLADELYSDRWITHGPQWGYDAAAELLRLEADNKELRLKLAEQPAQKRPQNCGTGYCSCIDCVMEPAQQGPVAWQPIETAPKDGRMILVCLPRQMNLVVRAWYRDYKGFWLTDQETDGGISRPAFFHEGDLWHPVPSIPGGKLYTTPQAQPAQRKPLTNEQLRSMCKQTWVFETVKQWARVIEAAHGIKENQT